MAVCVFKDVSVLVNGSPTKEVRLHKGLRQGDPLAPFLFLIVVEDLDSMMRKAVKLGKLCGYSFQQSHEISHLQYANDTLMVGNASFKNLWTLKGSS